MAPWNRRRLCHLDLDTWNHDGPESLHVDPAGLSCDEYTRAAIETFGVLDIGIRLQLDLRLKTK